MIRGDRLVLLCDFLDYLDGFRPFWNLEAIHRRGKHPTSPITSENPRGFSYTRVASLLQVRFSLTPREVLGDRCIEYMGNTLRFNPRIRGAIRFFRSNAALLALQVVNAGSICPDFPDRLFRAFASGEITEEMLRDETAAATTAQ